ncbi:MAG TPA: hypothetical protein VH234_04255 [Candidatus Saccharimonadales bacterium]|nr:hypothetical protein [Candidatus Saccharimonadales bacterium]
MQMDRHSLIRTRHTIAAGMAVIVPTLEIAPAVADAATPLKLANVALASSHKESPASSTEVQQSADQLGRRIICLAAQRGVTPFREGYADIVQLDNTVIPTRKYPFGFVAYRHIQKDGQPSRHIGQIDITASSSNSLNQPPNTEIILVQNPVTGAWIDDVRSFRESHNKGTSTEAQASTEPAPGQRRLTEPGLEATIDLADQIITEYEANKPPVRFRHPAIPLGGRVLSFQPIDQVP